MAEQDNSGWTIFAPAVCECIEAKPVTVNTPAGMQQAFALELLNHKTGQIYIKWLNGIKTAKGCSVKHQSDFAKLYRLTTGENPTKRYSKANQLVKHFVGSFFVAEYENAATHKGEGYLKVKSLKPVNPIVTDEWLSDGRLLRKKRAPITKNKLESNSDNAERNDNLDWKLPGDKLEIKKKFSGDELEIEKAMKRDFHSTSADISTRLKSITFGVKPYSHVKDMSITANNNLTTTPKSYQYRQQDDETIAQYHDRVIDESLSSDK